MIVSETLVYRGSEERPTSENMPEGTYKYVYDGENRGVIFARIQPSVPDHPVLQRVLSLGRRFDPFLDDAGRFGLRWQESEEEMAALVKMYKDDYEKRNEPFDADAYFAQIQANFGQTRVTLERNYGSSNLEYTPNPTTRREFMQRLQELFPEAQIVLEP